MRLMLSFLAALLFAASAVYAQSTWPTPQTPAGGPTVTGGVGLCLNGSNQAVPCGASTPSYVIAAQGTAASSGPWIETPWIAGAVNSATNGLYINLLQGNAVNAIGNPIFAQITNFPLASAGISVNQNAGVATVANSSHAANVSIGGLQTLSVFRTTGQPSGLLASIGARFLDGQTTSAVTVYLFKAIPASVTTCSGSNTCCKDNTAFAIIAADAENLVVPPFTITPSQFSGVTGFSYGNNPFSPAMPMANADSGATTNIYACVTVNTTYTPAANSLFLTANVVQD